MVGEVEGQEVEEGLDMDARAGADPTESGWILCPFGENIGSDYAPKLKWDGQETADVVSALHGICLSVFYSGFNACQHLYHALCLHAASAPSASCFLLLIHIQRHPAAFWKGGNQNMLGVFFFWSSHSLAQRRENCSTCRAINTSALWRAW